MGEKLSGYGFVEPLPDEIFHEHTYRSGNSTTKCVAPYCPNCSKNREKDTRQGGYREKWTTKTQDYHTSLIYKEDETGFYAVCSKCGHDVRNHEPKHDSYVVEEIAETIEEITLPLEMIEGVVYKEGFLIAPFTEYERIRKIGTSNGGQIIPSTIIEGNQYYISWENYLTKMRSIPNVSVVGIPRIYWKSTF